MYLGMVYAMMSIGVLGFVVWSHHMYSVGLDVSGSFILFSQLKFIAIQSGIIRYFTKGSTENIDRTKEILFGSLLGDGKLELPPRGVNARFGFTQNEGQKDYFIFVCNSLSMLCSAKYREIEYIDKRTGKTYKSLNFWTKALPMLTEFYHLWYSNKVKQVPTDLSLLTPLALAHWVAQRGLWQGKSLYLCTDGFDLLDIQRLKEYLIHKLNIKCTIHKKPGRNYRIYILVNSIQTVKDIISPYELKTTSEYKTDNNLALRPCLSFNTKRLLAKLSKRGVNPYETKKFYSTKDDKPNYFVPGLKYDNADLLKEEIVKENKARSGVYLWKKNLDGNCYIGVVLI